MLMKLVRNNEEVFIILYCLIILWVNIDYLRDYKNVKSGLGDISSEDEIEIKPDALSLVLLVLGFNFFRRWLMYILAIVVTGNVFVMVVSILLFVMDLYHALFNYSLAKLRKTNIPLYLAGADTVFASIFILYLFTS